MTPQSDMTTQKVMGKFNTMKNTISIRWTCVS